MNSDTPKKTIIYIEDNPANLKLVEQVLAHMGGVELHTAPNGVLGINLVENYRPHLILLDINLPGMDGFEVLKKIKNSPTLQTIPVVAISANAMPDDVEKGYRAGFDEYITKPIELPRLIELVNRYLGST
jgi:CheY-like chemotaxis protein